MRVISWIKQTYRNLAQPNQNSEISTNGLEKMLRKEVSLQGQSASANTIEFGRLPLIFGFLGNLPYSPAYALPIGTVALVSGKDRNENPLYRIFAPKDPSDVGAYVWNSKVIPLAQDIQEAYSH